MILVDISEMCDLFVAYEATSCSEKNIRNR